MPKNKRNCSLDTFLRLTILGVTSTAFFFGTAGNYFLYCLIDNQNTTKNYSESFINILNILTYAAFTISGSGILLLHALAIKKDYSLEKKINNCLSGADLAESQQLNERN